MTYLIIFVACVLSFLVGTFSKARETHIHYHEKEIKIPVDEEGKPVYNPSKGDPDAIQWLNLNKK